MSGGWAGSQRRASLPPEWHRTRARIRRRDGHQCTHVDDDGRCQRAAEHVDHIVPPHLGGGEDDSNLRSLCAWHHGRKSSAEGNAAKAVIAGNAKRRPERHPGLL